MFPTLRRLLKSLPPGFISVDAGCAEGQYLFPNATRFPDATFIGLDKIQDNIDFCNAYAAIQPFKNTRFQQGAIEETTIAVPADIVNCIGVMQLIENDEQALRSIHAMLRPGGILLLEVPVNGTVILPLYKWVVQKFGHYETIHNRQRIYKPDELLAKISGSGFTIQKVEYTYGFFGKLGHEVFNIPFMYLVNGNLLTRFFAWLFMNILLPLSVILNAIDYCTGEKKNGNSMIVIAIANAAQ